MPAITGTVAMILASVGFQVYNSWRGSKQNALLQQKRQEFEQAAIKRQTERMWKLMREGEELNLQLEREKLKDRIKKLNEDVGMLLPELAVEKAINNWPMNVLPIVMKKQTLGNLIAGQFTESASLHCVFTPSNCTEFNKHVFFRVEKELERYCNQYWSMVSNHPIMFYSGAWKSKTSPTGTQVDLMRTALSNLPTILITPYFRPNDGKLVIQMHVWGVGSTDDNNMLSDTYEFEPNNFQRDYNNKDNYEKEAFLLDNIIEDLVPYLQCLIGYMADTYFWSSSGQAPLLPHLLIDKTINTDGMKYLVSDSGEYYERLLQNGEVNAKKHPFSHNYLISLYKGSAVLWDKERKRKNLETVFISSCNRYIPNNVDVQEDVYEKIRLLDGDEMPFELLKDMRCINDIQKRFSIINPKLDELFNVLLLSSNKIQYEIIDFDNCSIERVLQFADYRKKDVLEAQFFIFIVYNPDVIIGSFFTNSYDNSIYLKAHTIRYFIIRHIDSKEGCKNTSVENSKFVKNLWNRMFYCYNLNNQKLSKMKEKNFEQQFGESFERVGKGLGRMIDNLSSTSETSGSTVWEDAPSKQAPKNRQKPNGQENDSIQQILSYFMANAGTTIPAEKVENMTIQCVLDWVDKHATPFVDKVYILKGYNTQYKKYVFCVFFGSGDNIHIKEDSELVCYITSEFNEEMRQTFKENNICIIPLK